mgnify:FL=1
MIRKRINYLLVIITLFFGFMITVDAKENHTVDFSRKGSIEVTLHEMSEDTYVEGAEITIYKIADAYLDGVNLAFKYTDEFSSCSVSLDDLTIDDLSKKITLCVKPESVGTSLITNDLGTVIFNDLDLGLYLVSQTNKVEGYSNIDSFLVQIPKVIDNSWTYDIIANPKTDIYKEIDLVVNKVWNTDSNKLPEKVEIELLLDGEVIDTVILNSTNKWTHTFKNLEKSDKYSVREINIPKGYKVSYTNNEYIFTVTNTDTLANTGQLFYSIIILAVFGLVFILLGVIEIKKG